MTAPSPAVALVPAIAVALALAACGGGTDSSHATTATRRQAPLAATRLLSRSPAAERARRRRGPALLAPPLVVRRDDGPEIWVRVRFPLASRIDLRKNRSGLDRGGYEGTTRGDVTIMGIRADGSAPFAGTPADLGMGDSHGFTPNSKATTRGWCYGAEVVLDLESVREARALTTVRSGAPQTIRVAVTARGGGTTTYAVPIYDERDRRVSAAARRTRCRWP